MSAHPQTAENLRITAAIGDPEARQGDGDRPAARSAGTPATRQALLAVARLLGRQAATETMRSGASPASTATGTAS